MTSVFHLAAACVFMAGGCGTREAAPPPPPAVTVARPGHSNVALDDLLELMRRRLMLMHDVARWKWNEGKAITDRERERKLLDDLEQRGTTYGLERRKTREFMQAQIEAGKLIQEADFALWREKGQGKFSDVRDLNADLRPAIDALSDQMLAQLSRLRSSSEGEVTAEVHKRAAVLLRGEAIDDTVRTVATLPLSGAIAAPKP